MILFKAGHKDYVDKLDDYRKTRSFREGGRWNSPGTPALYFSSNVQNAMLELSNYLPDPVVANTVNVMGVFQTPPLRLIHLRPDDLPSGWHQYPYPTQTQITGDRYLLDENYDGYVVPSCAINHDLAESTYNDVRQSIYANVVVNPERQAIQEAFLLTKHTPIYSARAFAALEGDF